MKTSSTALDLEMEALLAQAEREGKWLHTFYQNIWFSPQELRALRAKGEFRWGARNWTLREPLEYLAEVEKAVRDAVEFRDRVAAQIRWFA